MASSDQNPGPMPPGDGSVPPGKPMTVGQHVVDKGAEMTQSFKPIKQMSQHVCTFAVYSHDMNRQIETHHYITRVNKDFLQCAVYDSDNAGARLIGVEYIVSGRILDSLEAEEQKLWHSHGHEIKSGLWVNPRVSETIQRPELKDLAQTYGKFWCTWQLDRGDRLPLGAPALMMSPQELDSGTIKINLVKKRDERYKMDTEELRKTRADMAVPEPEKPRTADYWKKTGKGFTIDIEQTPMKLRSTFP